MGHFRPGTGILYLYLVTIYIMYEYNEVCVCVCNGASPSSVPSSTAILVFLMIQRWSRNVQVLIAQISCKFRRHLKNP